MRLARHIRRRTDALRRLSAPTMPVTKRHDWLSFPKLPGQMIGPKYPAEFVEAVVRGRKGQHSIVDESRGMWVDKGRRA